MTEADLIEVNGLVARHGWIRKNSSNADAMLGIELRLLHFGVRLDHEIGAPDPHAPPGGTAIAMRKVA